MASFALAIFMSTRAASLPLLEMCMITLHDYLTLYYLGRYLANMCLGLATLHGACDCAGLAVSTVMGWVQEWIVPIYFDDQPIRA